MGQQKSSKKRKKNNTVTVHAWAAQKEGKLYKGEVKCLHIQRKRLIAMIEYLHPAAQQGRLHRFECDLPPRLGNQASRFLLACGLDANTVGTTICIDDVRAVVGMRFYPDPTDRDIMRIEFEKVPQTSGTGSVPNDRQSNALSESLVLDEEESEGQKQ